MNSKIINNLLDNIVNYLLVYWIQILIFGFKYLFSIFSCESFFACDSFSTTSRHIIG